MIRVAALAITMLMIIPSCTIEKRVYMSGYHIEWLNKNQMPDKQTAISKTKSKSTVDEQLETANVIDDDSFALAVSDNNVTASVDNSELTGSTILLPRIHFVKKTELKRIIPPEDCDIIILKNGQEIKAKVLEIGSKEIQYKQCDYPNGPTLYINKSEVFMIKYPNGTSTVISSTQKNNSTPNTDKTTTNNGSKSQIIAFLLCFFLGSMGIHRFYLGYIGIGVIQLLTLGGLGIWALIDLIRIITGDLKPKNGEYKDKL